MILGIDASHIRAGGGLTHLAELLKAANPRKVGVDQVVVWGGSATLARLSAGPWLTLVHEQELDRSSIHRARWQRFRLKSRLQSAKCDLLFAPSGSYTGGFRPFVTMSRNLLPFEPAERGRFGVSKTRARYHVLERTQTSTLRRAAGVIFLTEIARRQVVARTGPLAAKTEVIPHGLSPRFALPPRSQDPIGDYSVAKPFRWLYTSIVNMYKHQWHVAEAAVQLHAAGFPLVLDLVGPAYAPAERKLASVLARIDPGGKVVRYRGAVPHEAIDETYRAADAFIFASSCETFGQIILEAMAAGLPVAASDRSAIPEVAGDAAMYFDPEDPRSIAEVMRRVMEDHRRREDMSKASVARAAMFDWEKCADRTFKFLSDVARSA